MKNADKVQRIIDGIVGGELNHNQEEYCSIGHCGTAYCIAGWLNVLYNPDFRNLSEEEALKEIYHAEYHFDYDSFEEFKIDVMSRTHFGEFININELYGTATEIVEWAQRFLDLGEESNLLFDCGLAIDEIQDNLDYLASKKA